MLAGCATTTPASTRLEIPLRDALVAPCPTLAVPPEDALPPVAEDQAAQAAQLAERRYWMQRDIGHEVVSRRICRQRDEAVGLIAYSNQLANED